MAFTVHCSGVRGWGEKAFRFRPYGICDLHVAGLIPHVIQGLKGIASLSDLSGCELLTKHQVV